MIDNFVRYQKNLKLNDLYPSLDGYCACGCGRKLDGNKTRWYSRECRIKSLYEFYIIKGDSKIIREILFDRDSGFCCNCGVFDENWQADHILSVCEGGGGCTIDNFQTLCQECHKEKTFILRSNSIPNCSNIKTTSLNIFPSPLNT